MLRYIWQQTSVNAFAVSVSSLFESHHKSSSPYELDFWQPPSHVGAVVDVTVSPEDAYDFAHDLQSKGINFIIAINDLQQAIDDERTENDENYSLTDGSLQFDKYNRFDIIEGYFHKLRSQNSQIVTLVEIGKTHKNRSLTVVKVFGKGSCAKDAIWIDGGTHAHEWISPAAALNIINELVSGYDSNPEIQIVSIDWYILPVMNPDGYEYSQTKNRMWRKNRRLAECRMNNLRTVCCMGVDLNRNFDWFWECELYKCIITASGSSADPCHGTYHGTKSFSGPETKAVKEFLELNPPKAFITLHSYSQMWLIPYSHRRKSYPRDYSNGFGKLHVPYAYLVELRPNSTTYTNGFLLPKCEIKTTSEETWAAIKTIADELNSQSARKSISLIRVTDASQFHSSTHTCEQVTVPVMMMYQGESVLF
ncbi:unnamed protein product [Toxocara canis]|uniref:Peptidase_M14 domain-containing protein n=1 Tax=Toxocara canis TaxID=6265 RepID=A0A183UNG8_TOXCA|nr:unnamed protein product [Toxocara canis]